MRTPNHILIGPDATNRTVYCTEGRICGAEEAKNVDDAHIERLQCPEGGVIVPGAINAHTHLYSAFAALGMPAPQPPPENFVQILQRVWWKLDRVLDRETLLANKVSRSSTRSSFHHTRCNIWTKFSGGG